jgi:hypothetical protein
VRSCARAWAAELIACRTFSVAVTTAFHVVAAIDRIMLATKELVGEQYHIHGLRAHTATDGRPTFAALRPGRDA